MRTAAGNGARASYAITVIVRNVEIAAVSDFKGERFGALSRFFFGLRSIDVPVLHVVDLDLVAHVVLVRQLIHVPGRFCVRYQKT